jgi:predicted ATPase
VHAFSFLGWHWQPDENTIASRVELETPSHADRAGDGAMITKLSIANFKSIRQLDLDCKKINLFIGEPNTGKSNILEALALLSWCGRYSQPLSDYVRFQLVQDLFYDGLLNEEIKISMSLSSDQHTAELYVRFERDHFEFRDQPASQRFREVTHCHGSG